MPTNYDTIDIQQKIGDHDLIVSSITFVEMSDPIHMSLSTFRDSILSSIAQLEFQLRDVVGSRSNQPVQSPIVVDETIRTELQQITTRITTMEQTIQVLLERNNTIDAMDLIRQELLSIQPSINTKNILISSSRNTPALNAAIAAANPPTFNLSDTEDDDDMSSIHGEEEVELVDVPEEIQSEGVVEDDPLKQVVIQGTSYYMDTDNNLYLEIEDGYEQIGTYDPTHDTIELLVEDSEIEEEEEVEEEEAEVEVEEFDYKGKTYQRDADKNVYLDGEQIGTWNGTRIVRSS